MYYKMLCVDCNVLYVHIGCVQSAIMSSMSVSHAAAPSARLDCMRFALYVDCKPLGAYLLRHLHDEPLFVHME